MRTKYLLIKVKIIVCTNAQHTHPHTKAGRQSFNQFLPALYLLHDNLLCSQLGHVYLLPTYNIHPIDLYSQISGPAFVFRIALYIYI